MAAGDKAAQDTQVAKAVSFATAGIMFLVFILGTCSIFLEWWSGPSSSGIVGQAKSLKASISLWTYDLKLSVPVAEDSPEMREVQYSATWDDMCKLREQQLKEAPGECTKIQAARAMAILCPIMGLIAVVILVLATSVSPLLLLVATIVSLLSGICGVAGVLCAMMIGTSGLTGPGVLLLMICVVLSMLSFVLILFAAGKAMPNENDREVEAVRVSREERAEAANQKRLQEFQRLENAVKSGKSSARSGSSGGSQHDEEAPSENPGKTSKKAPVHLMRVLFWSQQEGYNEDDEIPTEMLELAFREIDKDGTGEIDSEELVEALRLCGLEVSAQATATVMKEIDKNASGDIDIHEFVEFFRHVEELNRFQKKTQARAQFLTFVCSFCFLFQIVTVGLLLMMFINMKKEEDPDMYSILKNVLIGCSGVLGVLFIFVIAIPTINLTLGSNIEAWQYHIEKAKAERLKKRKPSDQGSSGPAGPGRLGWSNSVSVAAGDSIPVNGAMYGASYRVKKQAAMMSQPAWDMPAHPEIVTLHASMRSAQSQPQDRYAVPGVIMGAAGEFERYDPAAYRTAAIRAAETMPSATFNPMHRSASNFSPHGAGGAGTMALTDSSFYAGGGVALNFTGPSHHGGAETPYEA